MPDNLPRRRKVDVSSYELLDATGAVIARVSLAAPRLWVLTAEWQNMPLTFTHFRDAVASVAFVKGY